METMLRQENTFQQQAAINSLPVSWLESSLLTRAWFPDLFNNQMYFLVWWFAGRKEVTLGVQPFVK